MKGQSVIEKFQARIDRFRESSKSHAITVGLRDLSEVMQILSQSKTEVEREKTANENLNSVCAVLENDRDTWRSRAEGLSQSIKKFKDCPYKALREEMFEALTSYDAAKRGTK